MALLERGPVLERRKKFYRVFIFYGHDFLFYYTHPENDKFAFRYPRHDKIVHNMTFRRIILRITLQPRLDDRNWKAWSILLASQLDAPTSTQVRKMWHFLFFVLLVTRSVMVIIGVRLFRFTLHGFSLIDFRFLRFPKAFTRTASLCSPFPPSSYSNSSTSPFTGGPDNASPDMGVMPKRGICYRWRLSRTWSLPLSTQDSVETQEMVRIGHNISWPYFLLHDLVVTQIDMKVDSTRVP